MKTKYSSLVSVKKNIMQKSELALQQANATLQKAREAFETSLLELQSISIPKQGTISEFLSSRALLDAQRHLIRHNKEWVTFAQEQVNIAKENLKKTMMDYEKFKYLELQEIEQIISKRKIKEVKDLDEVALMTFSNNSTAKAAS